MNRLIRYIPTSLLVAAAVIGATFVPTHAAFAQGFSFSFAGDPGTQLQDPVATQPTGFTVSPLIRGSGVNPAPSQNSFTADQFYDAGDTNVAGTGNGTFGTLAEAIAQNEYFSFTITPDAGFQFTLDSITLTAKRLGQGPSLYQLYAGTPGAAGSTFFAISTEQTVTANTGIRTITLTGLTNVTTATEIRLYGYQSAGAGVDQSGLILQDALAGTGSFQPVPAPPAAVSLAIGGLVGMIGTGVGKMRARRRKPAAK